jgi:DNA-binding transcriptional MocR family regulator
MRCGYIKAPADKVALLNAHIRANIWLSSPINNIAGTHLIESGKAFEIAETQRQTASERQRLARGILTSISSDAAGYHLWLPLPKHWTTERFVMEAKNRGLIVSSGSYFEVSGNEDNHIRLSLMSIPTEERLAQGLGELKALLDSNVDTLFPF